jgi:hypothetical protein
VWIHTPTVRRQAIELTGSSLSLLAAIVAALIGTGAMTISSASEVAWTERGDSLAPGVALLWPLKVALGLKVEAVCFT